MQRLGSYIVQERLFVAKIKEREKFDLILKSIFLCTFYMQMFPIAVTCGNTFILKPSEKDPGDCQNHPSNVI